MDVSEIMTKRVEVVRPDATIEEAAQKMKDIDVGSLPVCDGRKLRGMVTDRDVAIRAVAEGRDPRQTKVKDIMTADIVYGRTGQDVKEIAETIQLRVLEYPTHVFLGEWVQPIARRKSVSGNIESAVTVFWNVEKK